MRYGADSIKTLHPAVEVRRMSPPPEGTREDVSRKRLQWGQPARGHGRVG